MRGLAPWPYYSATPVESFIPTCRRELELWKSRMWACEGGLTFRFMQAFVASFLREYDSVERSQEIPSTMDRGRRSILGAIIPLYDNHIAAQLCWRTVRVLSFCKSFCA